MSLPKIISIVGPTASGKTGLGIEIAKLVDGEVISVDSRQVYRGMDIGTAKDGRDHWGIDLVEPNEAYSVADFKVYAEEKIEEIIKRKRVPILVGGTGLWMQAVMDNYDLAQTTISPVLRTELEKRSVEDLFAEFKRLDPEGAEVIDKDNPRRLVRALEVTLLSGKPFSQQQTKGEAKYDVLQIGLQVDRAVLNERINHRVDEMIENGLVEEVQRLKTKYGCDIEAMSGIGYRQIGTYLNGETTLVEAIEEIKKVTRHYAKRQMTWFKRDQRIHWVRTNAEAIALIESTNLLSF